MENLLVVVDMVNGFVNFGNLADPKINKITPNIVALIENIQRENLTFMEEAEAYRNLLCTYGFTQEELAEQAKQKGMKILAFKDCHTPNDIEFQSFPPHCIKGTPECELIPEIKKYEDDMYVIEKPTTNGFVTPEFAGVMQRNKFDNIIVCGCCTDICVQNFCTSLMEYLQKNNIQTNVHVYESTVATFDSPTHNAEEYQKSALKQMQEIGVNVKYDCPSCEKDC